MTETEVLFNGRWLQLKRRGRWEFVERTNPGGAVIIVALTPDNDVLFVEQWREAILSKTIEMPAGLIGDLAGDANENAVSAAHRELIEETGWRAARIDVCHEGPSSSGMSTEMITFVRASGLERVGVGGGDATENIIVHAVPREQAARWLLDKRAEGYSIDPKLFAGLYFLDHGAELFGAAPGA